MFLKLGCVCFGGPAAHVGYFREEFVVRRQWISEIALAELIGLTQLLPGPSSSQTGFYIGIVRGGLAGGVWAWLGFTLPSAILMIIFAAGVTRAHGAGSRGAMHGLAVAAVAVVANAVLSMFRRLCPDLIRALIAAAAAAVVTASGGSWSQIGAIVAGGAIGWLVLPEPEMPASENDLLRVSRSVAVIALALFVGIFATLGFWARLGADRGGQLLYAFYRTGALVFGGGHVVLPLLEQAVVRPGWINQSDFLAGYGAAQALPGPLFTFSAFLGFVSRIPPSGAWGAALSVIALFLPGLLLALAITPFWRRLRRVERAGSMMAGVNASVVGLLASALVHAGVSGAVANYLDAALAVLGFILLVKTRVSPVLVVLGIAAASAARAVIV